MQTHWLKQQQIVWDSCDSCSLLIKAQIMVDTLPYLVGVPETDSAAEWQLPHQKIVHPPESKLQVLHFIPLEMIVNVLWQQTQIHTPVKTGSPAVSLWKQVSLSISLSTYHLSCWLAPLKLSLCSEFQAEQRCSCPEKKYISIKLLTSFKLALIEIVSRPVFHPAACSCTRNCQLQYFSEFPEVVLLRQSSPYPPLEKQITLTETDDSYQVFSDVSWALMKKFKIVVIQYIT